MRIVMYAFLRPAAMCWCALHQQCWVDPRAVLLLYLDACEGSPSCLFRGVRARADLLAIHQIPRLELAGRECSDRAERALPTHRDLRLKYADAAQIVHLIRHDQAHTRRRRGSEPKKRLVRTGVRGRLVQGGLLS